MDLKAETVSLAVAMELPMVIVDVQRAGPSTGLPTKTEQGDLLMALYGRHGESPLPVVAAATPGGCFDSAIEAVRIAVKYRTPVVLLADTFLSNSSEPWRLPDVSQLPDIDPGFATEPNSPEGFMPYLRDANLARPWAVPGTPGLRHRIGGLEKEDGSGDISYEPENHEHMTRLRAERVERWTCRSWRSTTPTGRRAARARVGLDLRRDRGCRAARPARARREAWRPRTCAISIRYRATPGDVLRRYRRVLVPEMNMGQLVTVLRARYLVDCESYTKVDGLPIFTRDVMDQILERGG